jgi:hypothetical protein
MRPALKSGVRLLLSFAVSFALLLTRGQAQPAQIAEFPFQLREGLIWIEVTVPQSAKPLNFMLDSGAGVSVINLHVAQRLGLRLGKRVSVHGVQSTAKGYWPEHLAASVGEVRLPEEYLAVDLGDLSRACACAVDGLLGADFFREHVVQIDFAARKIRLLKSFNPGKGAESVPLEMRSCGMRLPVQVNGGRQQWMRLDTGCASALQWVTSEVPSGLCSRQIAIGMATVSVPLTETNVRLGQTEFQAVPTGLHDKEIFAGESGLLGNGLLSRFSTVTVDVAAGRLILEKPRAAD